MKKINSGYSLFIPLSVSTALILLSYLSCIFFNAGFYLSSIHELSRYLDNRLCQIIIFIFLVILVYFFIQLIGLKLDTIRFLSKKEANGPGTSLKIMSYISGRGVTYLVSSKPSNHDALAMIELRYEEVLTPLSFGIWVLPVIGFIGTVIGITDAIGGIEPLMTMNASQGGASLGESMGSVISGLKYAFDTTLVGLVLVIPTMINFYYLKLKMARLDTIYLSKDARSSEPLFQADDSEN
jgi:hypothetical protein